MKFTPRIPRPARHGRWKEYPSEIFRLQVACQLAFDTLHLLRLLPKPSTLALGPQFLQKCLHGFPVLDLLPILASEIPVVANPLLVVPQFRRTQTLGRHRLPVSGLQRLWNGSHLAD